MIKKRSICFVLSDFIDDNFEQSLKIASRKHDLVALKIEDPGEEELPKAGWLLFRDSENGEMTWVNSNLKRNRLRLKHAFLERNKRIKEQFTRAGVDNITIRTNKPYVRSLMNLFKQRTR